ncbi:preprotein translocase subunit YajC [Brevibacterium atlanticum]|uniref:preprotein translocase subunit YajC n=1 Tax=Brevibacterium atlanticum TaxID=2697563 RepID=UPI001D1858F3|nr:preprotein translocase subunit YajC [Brevibacterium atlanticum]
MDLLIPLALAALLIFFLFNSRRKQKARAEQIKSGLVPGATVMTTFGVFGTVLSIDEENNQVTIESGPGTVLRVHRQAIGQIDNPEAATAVDAPVADAPAADTSAAETSAAETDGEKPAITDAELDAMNARKRAEKDSDADSESTDVAESADSAVEPTDVDSAVDADSTVVDESVAEADGADDAAEIDSDVDEADSTESDTDKKN